MKENPDRNKEELGVVYIFFKFLVLCNYIYIMLPKEKLSQARQRKQNVDLRSFYSTHLTVLNTKNCISKLSKKNQNRKGLCLWKASEF